MTYRGPDHLRGAAIVGAVYKLCCVIDSLERYALYLGDLDRAYSEKRALEMRNIIYLRNTLGVCTNAIADDLTRRLSRSVQGYTTYCMTDGEKRRFHMDWLRSLNYTRKGLETADMARAESAVRDIDTAQQVIKGYIQENGRVLRILIESGHTGLGFPIPPEGMQVSDPASRVA